MVQALVLAVFLEVIAIILLFAMEGFTLELVFAGTSQGSLDLVSLGGHHRVSQRRDHLGQQIRRGAGQVLFQ